MLARPGVEKGRHVPEPHKMKELSKDVELQKKAAEGAKAWIQTVSPPLYFYSLLEYFVDC